LVLFYTFFPCTPIGPHIVQQLTTMLFNLSETFHYMCNIAMCCEEALLIYCDKLLCYGVWGPEISGHVWSGFFISVLQTNVDELNTSLGNI